MPFQSEQNPAEKTVRQQVPDGPYEFSYADFADLAHHPNYDRFLAGRLTLPTGRVVCCDPMHRQAALPQTWAVPPGDYPVYLSIGLADNDYGFAGRVAYAELVVREQVPVAWELSLIPDELADEFARMMAGSYVVQNGLSCFADYATLQRYEQEIAEFNAANPAGNYYTDVLDPLFQQNDGVPASSRGQDWLNYPIRGTSANIILFGTGNGDGIYNRYVGYDAQGEVVRLLTDFIQVE